jgi:hypothetical protein
MAAAALWLVFYDLAAPGLPRVCSAMMMAYCSAVRLVWSTLEYTAAPHAGSGNNATPPPSNNTVPSQFNARRRGLLRGGRPPK